MQVIGNARKEYNSDAPVCAYDTYVLLERY